MGLVVKFVSAVHSFFASCATHKIVLRANEYYQELTICIRSDNNFISSAWQAAIFITRIFTTFLWNSLLALINFLIAETHAEFLLLI